MQSEATFIWDLVSVWLPRGEVNDEPEQDQLLILLDGKAATRLGHLAGLGFAGEADALPFAQQSMYLTGRMTAWSGLFFQ